MSDKRNDDWRERPEHKVSPWTRSLTGIRPTCTCGWEGRVYGRSDNFQYDNALDEARKHAKESGHFCVDFFPF